MRRGRRRLPLVRSVLVALGLALLATVVWTGVQLNSFHGLQLGVQDGPPIRISNFAMLAPDDRTLTVGYPGSAPWLEPGASCWRGARAMVETFPDRVTITLLEQHAWISEGGTACERMAHPRRLVVDLGEPVSGRPIVNTEVGMLDICDGSVLLPVRDLPDGWIERDADAEMLSLGSPGWSRTFAPAEPASEPGPLRWPEMALVTQAIGTVASPPGTARGSVAVRGTTGSVYERAKGGPDGFAQRAIVWEEAGTTVTLEGWSAGTWAAPGDSWPTEALVAWAERHLG